MAQFLVLGEVANEAVPATAAAELFLLSQGYGAPYVMATPGLIETPDFAPAGPVGEAIVEQIVTLFRYGGALQLSVTPIMDFNVALPTVTRTYPAPTVPIRGVLKAPVGTQVTYVRLRIEILSTTGPVELYAPIVIAQPKGDASLTVLSTQEAP